MLKQVRKNKNRDLRKENCYFREIHKSIKEMNTLCKLEKAGKIIWLPCAETSKLFRRDTEAAYRKGDKYRCRPLAYRYTLRSPVALSSNAE